MPNIEEVIEAAEERYGELVWGAGKRYGPIDGRSIDAEVARESVCHKCLHEGLNYDAFHTVPTDQGEPSVWISVASCPRCGEAFEF